MVDGIGKERVRNNDCVQGVPWVLFGLTILSRINRKERGRLTRLTGAETSDLVLKERYN
jgi:hypothetical protein